MATRLKARTRRAGRPVGSPPNREAILAAARKEFSQLGYDRATIRGIAARAGIDPALVHHYFGSKDRLLAESLSLPINPAAFVLEILSGDQDGLGERLLRRFLQIWASEPTGGGALIGLVRTAAGNDEAARMIREFLQREVLGRIAAALKVDQPQLRAALAGSQLIGLAMARFVVRVEPLATADTETLVAAYAPTLQRYLTGPLRTR